MSRFITDSQTMKGCGPLENMIRKSKGNGLWEASTNSLTFTTSMVSPIG